MILPSAAEQRSTKLPKARGSTGTSVPVPTVVDGVFFHAPVALRRGNHGMPREQVQAAQRERMLAATTELLAAHGYADFTIADVARRAGVSLGAFYGEWPNKDAAIFAGYDRFIEVIVQRITGLDVQHLDGAALVQANISSYLGALSSDLVVARAYQVEIDALGGAARLRRRLALTALAEVLREQAVAASPRGAPVSRVHPAAWTGVVYAVRQLASDALDASVHPDLEQLGRNAQSWVARALDLA